MAIEKTRFDDWLKQELWRDLTFRALVWVIIAGISAYYALSVDAKTANQYFNSQTNSVFRLSNLIGTMALFLGAFALMFKDLEAISPGWWGRDTVLGGFGGVVRRLAGDLTLWILGALVSILLVVGVYGYSAHGSFKDWVLFSLTYIILALMCVGLATFNIMVRRVEPFIAIKFKNPWGVFFFYVVVLVLFPIYIHFVRWGQP